MPAVKKNNADCEPPPGWIVLELAIPPGAWATYCRAAVRSNCEGEDIVNAILRSGFERCQVVELAEANEHHAKAKQH